MRTLLTATLAVAFLLSAACASGPALIHRPYRACVFDDDGRFRLGTVIGEQWGEDERGKRVLRYVVQLDEYPADGRHITIAKRVDRFCSALKGGEEGQGVGAGVSAEQPRW
jgi:hypothetical protein